MLARITGAVLNTETFTGNARATGQPFSIHTAIVLVADRETVRVQYEPTGQSAVQPRRGDLVDWLVDVGTYRGDASLRHTGDWPEDDSTSV